VSLMNAPGEAVCSFYQSNGLELVNFSQSCWLH
jgi:hypothetical protein